jgi:hypothetical protein
MENPQMTRHAKQRSQQRGASTKGIAIVMAYGDIEVPAQGNCRFVRLSHRAAASLLAGGGFPVQEIDRAKRLMVLVDATDRIVTVLKCDPARSFRELNHYWRRR